MIVTKVKLRRNDSCPTKHILFFRLPVSVMLSANIQWRVIQGNKFPCYKIGRADGTCISPWFVSAMLRVSAMVRVSRTTLIFFVCL